MIKGVKDLLFWLHIPSTPCTGSSVSIIRQVEVLDTRDGHVKR